MDCQLCGTGEAFYKDQAQGTPNLSIIRYSTTQQDKLKIKTVIESIYPITTRVNIELFN